MKACAFAGYRPDGFFFKNNERHPLCERIKDSLLEQAKAVYRQGARRFLWGGGQGAGLWAAEAICTMKQSSDYPGTTLICALPFDGFGRDLGDADYDRFSHLISLCDDVLAISSPGDSRAEQKRSRYMVEHAEYLIAVYDAARKPRSDVGEAVDYAKKLDRSIILIHPESAAVTSFIIEQAGGE